MAEIGTTRRGAALAGAAPARVAHTFAARTLAVLTLAALTALAACSDGPAELGRRLAAAKAHLARRHYDPALADFDAVLAIDPKHFEARQLKAEILYNQAKLGAAAAILVELRHESASDVKVAWTLAMIRKDQRRFDEALALFESLPPRDRPDFAFAETLTGLDRHDEAANVICRHLVADPWDSRAYYLLSRIESRRGRTEPAGFWGRQFRGQDQVRRDDGLALGMEHAGQQQQAMLFRAQSLCRRGRWFAGLQELTRIVQRDNTVAPAYYMIGRIMAGVGNPALASDAFQRALVLEPGNANALQALAGAQASLKAGGGEVLTPLAAVARHAARGDLDHARAAALFAAKAEPDEKAPLRAVLQFFDRREDVFVRLWALQRARRIAPDDAALRASWDAELAQLAVTI